MTDSDFDEIELVVPTRIRDSMIGWFGTSRTDTYIVMMEWAIAHRENDLFQTDPASNVWRRIFSGPSESGELVQWLFEVEFADERQMLFVTTRVCRLDEVE